MIEKARRILDSTQFYIFAGAYAMLFITPYIIPTAVRVWNNIKEDLNSETRNSKGAIEESVIDGINTCKRECKIPGLLGILAGTAFNFWGISIYMDNPQLLAMPILTNICSEIYEEHRK